MSRRWSQNLSHRRRYGIVGTNTRQRVALDWRFALIGHPLSLHYISEGPTGLVRISAPPPSPNQTGGPHVRARQHLSVE